VTVNDSAERLFRPHRWFFAVATKPTRYEQTFSEAAPSPASHPCSGLRGIQHYGREPRLTYEDSILQKCALIRVKHAVIALRCVEGRACSECAEEPVGLRCPEKNEPQPLEQPGSDDG